MMSCTDGTFMFIKPDDARYTIDPVMSQLFCYDEPEYGQPVIDGYHWEIEFHSKKGLLETFEGWPGENNWRRDQFIGIVRFAERYIPQNLGGELMNWWYEDDPE